LASKEIIDSYFDRLNVVDGRINFKSFKKFIEMLDTVLVDDDGTVLGFDDLNQAVNLDDVDTSDEE
jgi:hypothetical protein